MPFEGQTWEPQCVTSPAEGTGARPQALETCRQKLVRCPWLPSASAAHQLRETKTMRRHHVRCGGHGAFSVTRVFGRTLPWKCEVLLGLRRAYCVPAAWVHAHRATASVVHRPRARTSGGKPPLGIPLKHPMKSACSCEPLPGERYFSTALPWECELRCGVRGAGRLGCPDALGISTLSQHGTGSSCALDATGGQLEALRTTTAPAC